MKTFIFRNNTIEFFFNQKECAFSGYDDISFVPEDSENYIWFYQTPYGIIDDKAVELVKSYKQKFDLIFSQISSHKEIIVFTLCKIDGSKISASDFSFEEAINDFNSHILELAANNKNIKIIDFSEFVSKYPQSDFIDWKYYFTSQLAFSAKLAKDFKAWFDLQKNKIALKRKKCIVFDLDNTLWGGVLGEDGIEGIKIGGDYPGKAFLYFQKTLIELSKSGIILAVCSKNNENDVFECWNKNHFNLINKEYISAYRINWNNKADNIREIASELNIGLDSFVFIDDNPTERELVKQSLPDVVVPEFPEQAYGLVSFVEELTDKYFSVYSLTEEDRNKTSEYKANVKRKNAEKSFADIDSFIKSLEIKLSIQKVNEMNISRIAQMTQKTNQFNLTTRRYTENDIQKLVSENVKIWCLSVRDRFGDSGITGAIIVKNDKIDELLLSCRILGKKIEYAFVSKILVCLKNEGMKTLKAEYFPTLKNGQVKEFYEKCGFSLLKEETNGEKQYSIDLEAYVPIIDDKYEINMEE